MVYKIFRKENNILERVKLKEMKVFNKILIIFLICSLFVGCGKNTEENTQQTGNEKQQNEKVTFLLDWTPNTNHTGIYVALEKGFYNEVGIDLEILNPPEESTTALVAAGKADFGISFQDTMAMALNENEDFPIVAIAAIIQHNTSGILSLKEKGIDNFKNLEGKIYATWDNDLEQATIRQVMENGGGDFNKVELYHSTVTDAVSAIQTNVDAVWVFEAWDTMNAKVNGLDYNFIKFKDVEPSLDFYTPVIVSSKSFLEKNGHIAKRFLEATKKGYEYAIENPEESAKILHKFAPEYDINMLIESQNYLASQYKAEVEQWGYIDAIRWNNFYNWAYEKGILTKDLKNIGFTNDYLPK